MLSQNLEQFQASLSELCMITLQKLFTICCHTYWINYQSHDPEIFPDIITLLKVDLLSNFEIGIKLNDC